MTKKIVILSICAALLVVGCIVGLSFNGSVPAGKAGGSNISVENPQDLADCLTGLPTMEDYYAGTVKDGKVNGKSFNTMTVRANAEITGSGSHVSTENTTIVEAYYGEDSILFSFNYRRNEKNTYSSSESKYGPYTMSIEVEGDVYVEKGVMYARFRKYNFYLKANSTKDYYSILKDSGLEAQPSLAKTIQSNLNKWIDLDTTKAKKDNKDKDSLKYLTTVSSGIATYSVGGCESSDAVIMAALQYATAYEQQVGIIEWNVIGSKYFLGADMGMGSSYVEMDFYDPETPMTSMATSESFDGVSQSSSIIGTFTNIGNTQVKKVSASKSIAEISKSFAPKYEEFKKESNKALKVTSDNDDDDWNNDDDDWNNDDDDWNNDDDDDDDWNNNTDNNTNDDDDGDEWDW